MGVQRAGAELPELNPDKGRALNLQPGDRLVLVGDAF